MAKVFTMPRREDLLPARDMFGRDKQFELMATVDSRDIPHRKNFARIGLPGEFVGLAAPNIGRFGAFTGKDHVFLDVFEQCSGENSISCSATTILKWQDAIVFSRRDWKFFVHVLKPRTISPTSHSASALDASCMAEFQTMSSI
ncbi:MAG: hypothetical protein ACR2PI_21590 [Hyphomicrobiaceae bacterium]